MAVSYKLDDGFGIIPFLQRNAIKVLPVLFSFIALFLMYSVVPNRRVRIPYAAVGALFAAIFLELGKRLFSLYIIYFPSYQNIYGAIAVVPILLVWIYVSWLIVFFGVEIQATLQDMYDLKRKEIDLYNRNGTVLTGDQEAEILSETIEGNRSLQETGDSGCDGSNEKENEEPKN